MWHAAQPPAALSSQLPKFTELGSSRARKLACTAAALSMAHGPSDGRASEATVLGCGGRIPKFHGMTAAAPSPALTSESDSSLLGNTASR